MYQKNLDFRELVDILEAAFTFHSGLHISYHFKMYFNLELQFTEFSMIYYTLAAGNGSSWETIPSVDQ